MTLELTTITMDCADAVRTASFWAAALGCDVDAGAAPEFASIRPSAGLALSLVAVPEAKATKNRVHVDLRAADPDAEVGRLVALGATVHACYDEGGSRWTTLRDVEGNEFCVV